VYGQRYTNRAFDAAGAMLLPASIVKRESCAAEMRTKLKVLLVPGCIAVASRLHETECHDCKCDNHNPRHLVLLIQPASSVKHDEAHGPR
jgi:hypothetical protein